jgi:hypothetical protein
MAGRLAPSAFPRHLVGAAASPTDKSCKAQRPPTSHSSKDLMPLAGIVDYLMLSVVIGFGQIRSRAAPSQLDILKSVEDVRTTKNI